MFSFFRKKEFKKSVTFATSCFEKDWKEVLRSDYLEKKQIENHCFSFDRKMLVVNNVKDPLEVVRAAKDFVRRGALTHVYLAEDSAKEVLSFFGLKRSDFTTGADAKDYPGVSNDWIYFNAIGALSAIYRCETDYLLYLTGDARLEEKIEWIPKAIERMEKKKSYKVANLTWNSRYEEAKAESVKEERDFYVAKRGFSDQMFLVKREDFRQPIYSEIREDAVHFPRGDVFEKRVYSYMINHGWKRITYKKGSYLHENF